MYRERGGREKESERGCKRSSNQHYLFSPVTRAFFSPSSMKGKAAKPSSSSSFLAGKKRPISHTDDTRDMADHSSENSTTNKGQVTSTAESPVFKSKSKQPRVIIDSDEEEEEEVGGGGGVRGEDSEGVREGGGGGAVGKEEAIQRNYSAAI